MERCRDDTILHITTALICTTFWKGSIVKHQKLWYKEKQSRPYNVWIIKWNYSATYIHLVFLLPLQCHCRSVSNKLHDTVPSIYARIILFIGSIAITQEEWPSCGNAYHGMYHMSLSVYRHIVEFTMHQYQHCIMFSTLKSECGWSRDSNTQQQFLN